MSGLSLFEETTKSDFIECCRRQNSANIQTTEEIFSDV